MANTITAKPVGRQGPIVKIAGFVPFEVVTTETYATATGGFGVDFTDFLTLLKIADIDILFIIGMGILGHSAIFTKTGSGDAWTVKLWNGATEIADGALTQTIRGAIFFSPGASS